ncbi:hypothetical protein HUT16_13080 [Kitasatospora sp. NA04385]|uniref:hypothetical protein n=1 Tax=Kitasatospora sp. NA04385 TaxID=2742135 RepID=UPI0015901ECC|nr:hypothetical protein [Kitasatospora sp. NA04385]QKW19867.1 hypothetical protein HUT16_13080 [Kitasatospora sp. NA04385]
MKQATLKAAGAAALGVAFAAVAAGSASAAPVAPGGLGLPTSALTNPGVTGAATGAVSKLPGGDQLGTVTGTLNPAAGAPAVAPAEEQAPPVAEQTGPGGVDQEQAPAAANRIGGLDSVPGGQGLSKTPVGGVVGTLSSLSPTGGGAPGLPSLPGLGG